MESISSEYFSTNADLFENDELCDFTFIVGNEKFMVHTQILASKSSVFLAMFTIDMKEAQTRETTITDIDSKVNTLYCNSKPNEYDGTRAHCWVSGKKGHVGFSLKKRTRRV
ncbi:protein roadkill-like [Leptopilina boulardi]|uniref:protein roadkill-like n=1 Tax=Leptopilina boulardi TaxID=63433 RepID=UPI0021F650FE|nr:protein roadkill-like [Leptopilina boulardi]